MNESDIEVEFTKGLYDDANEQLKDVYKEQKVNRDELLQEIAKIMLIYNVADNIMKLAKNQISSLYSSLGKLITKNSRNQAKNQTNIIKNILTNTANSTFYHYSYNTDLKDVQKIIDANFKGKHFSDRVWDNETEVAKHLHKKVNDFLNGKVNVNQIKSDIEKTFNTNAYNVKRLTETEVSRVHNQSFLRFCKETGVDKLKYNATLDTKTCEDCAHYDGKIYDFGKEPGLPRHPMCRCFYEIDDDNSKVSENEDNKKQPFVMDLQLFREVKDQDELIKLIKSGVVDEIEFSRFESQFNSIFKNGIKTPLGTVRNTNKREYHIIFRHRNLIGVENVNRIKETLENPECIKEAIDSYGNVNKGYIRKYGNRMLLIIVNDDIITSYYPGKNYIKNNVEGWKVLWEEK